MLKEYAINKQVNIRHLYTAFEVYYDSGFSFDGESHDFWEVVYVIDGVVEASADENVYRLSKNQMIFHKPMEFHKLWTPAGEHSHLFILSFIADGDSINEFRNSVFSLNVSQQEQMLRFINLFRNVSSKTRHTKPSPEYISHWNDTPYFSQIAANNLELLFLMLLEDNKKVSAVTHNPEAEIYNRIIKLMQNNINSQMSLLEIARSCNISVSTLKTLFSEYSGYGVHKYFIKLKINAAIELLQSGKSIAAISEELGFNNPNYFSYVFKRETGHSPRGYLQQMTKKK